jgi:hypothetical protein
MKSTQFSLTDTRTKIVNAHQGAQWIYLHVEGNNEIYLGGADVTSSNGLHTVKHTTPIAFFLPPNNELWAVCASGETADVRILQEKNAL